MKSLKLTTIRFVAAVAAIVVLIALPRRTYAVTVRAPKFARATIPARWGIPRKQKKKGTHVGVGARKGGPRAEKLRHYSAVCSAGEEKRVLSLTGTAEFVLAVATIPIAVALPLFRNAEPVVALEIDRWAGYDKKQNKGELTATKNARVTSPTVRKSNENDDEEDDREISTH